jgi:sugar lactone lactonase YvrE
MRGRAVTAPQLAWRLDCQLGEGPVWLAEEQALAFVDIRLGRIHRFHPGSDDRQSWDVGGRPSFIVPARDGRLLVGSGHAIHPFEDGTLGAPLATIPQAAHNRTNDATVDATGRLWLGTMDDDETIASGAIWCLDRGALHRAGGEAVVTNGPAICAENRYLYHVDSGQRTIWRSALGAEPAIVASEVFIQLSEEDGHPDGVVVDSENCLWVALWDGWGVRRYAPDGALLQHIALPCARVTKMAFGGADLRTAYVTTARVGLDAAALAAQPLAGSLFQFPVAAPGRVLPAVRTA